MSVFFTAAVCVYNTEKYLRDCLDSILSQSYENIELLIIDDGSTDGSGKVCDEYAEKDSRVRVIHTENRGLLLARRTAFENARGDYFIFFDSDDTVDPKIFTLINEEIQKSHCDMVFSTLANAIPTAPLCTKSFSTKERPLTRATSASFGSCCSRRDSTLCA